MGEEKVSFEEDGCHATDTLVTKCVARSLCICLSILDKWTPIHNMEFVLFGFRT